VLIVIVALLSIALVIVGLTWTVLSLFAVLIGVLLVHRRPPALRRARLEPRRARRTSSRASLHQVPCSACCACLKF
jgi:hypothetical protein